jgi:hypothetical protein
MHFGVESMRGSAKYTTLGYVQVDSGQLSIVDPVHRDIGSHGVVVDTSHNRACYPVVLVELQDGVQYLVIDMDPSLDAEDDGREHF